jgi:DNA-binding winged helix-turn-helix (wHTH) protein
MAAIMNQREPSVKIRGSPMRHAFGDCILDRARRELTRGGEVVHTGPKLLALLELLIDAAPRAVTKDEVHKALWPDTFISEATLTSLVAELRAAIGDRARAPRLVRTVHGYGYAFVADLAAAPPARGAGPTLLYCIIAGDREIPLPNGRHILGRAPDSTVVVDDGGVSRHHARITIDLAGATLEDLGSKNGTMLNGEPIEAPTPLDDGAQIVLGATALRFRALESLASTATVRQQLRNPKR